MAQHYRPGTMPDVFQLIELVGKKLTQLQRNTVKESDLTPPQFATLYLLWQADRQPLKDLAEGVFCTPATMTSLVDTLEKKGLVQRLPNPNDRRSILIVLTEAGVALQQTTASLEDMFNACCTTLTPDETRELSRLLKKLNDSL
jgi:DNA-binding MarR family transcriptional regulator